MGVLQPNDVIGQPPAALGTKHVYARGLDPVNRGPLQLLIFTSASLSGRHLTITTLDLAPSSPETLLWRA